MSEPGQSDDASHVNGAHDTSPSATHKRQRAKQACEPCRLRKRKCDSTLPCNMCSQFEYKCFYPRKRQKRSKIVEQNTVEHDQLSRSESFQHELAQEDQGGLEDASKMKAQEANSGIAFTRLLGLRLDPSSGPKLFTFGWNLGNTTFKPAHFDPITSFLTSAQMAAMARRYFAHVHPLYGFLDRESFEKHMLLRWTDPTACKLPDHLLAGVAAIGVLYSDGALTSILPALVNSAKCALEGSSTIYPPGLVDVQSWILRCLYLRVTDHPHAAWMASSTTMHLIESTGIHQEASSQILHPAVPGRDKDPELCRRAFWVARMLSTWISFEYGRTRVALRGISARLPTPRPGDFTVDFINLYSFSCRLDPERSHQASQWEDFLRRLDAYEVHHDAIELTRANLGLCGYRRLRLANPSLSPDSIRLIVSIGLRGLDAVRRLAAQGMPWWHVANVPFQCVCVFLAMDVRESLAHVATALRTLEDVVARFDTPAVREALKTARFLVRLSKKRKDEDSSMLSDCLRKDVPSETSILLPPSSSIPRHPQQRHDTHPRSRDAMTEVNNNNGNSFRRRESGVDDDDDEHEAENDNDNDSATATHHDLSTSTRPVVRNDPTGRFAATPGTTLSAEDWSLEILNNSQFDWNYFLTADMPAFNNFAPDGTM